MLKDWTSFEKAWIVTFTLINVYLFFAWQDSALGLITSITGMFCVVLAAKGKISTYYFGIIQTATYAYISYGYGFYGWYYQSKELRKKLAWGFICIV